MSLIQYLRDTQGELRHVAWPTRLQTIVYTILVALISVGVALYLGFFDFLFTTGLARFLLILPSAAPVAQTQNPTSTSSVALKLNTGTSTVIPASTTTPKAPVAPVPAKSLEDTFKVK